MLFAEWGEPVPTRASQLILYGSRPAVSFKLGGEGRATHLNSVANEADGASSNNGSGRCQCVPQRLPQSRCRCRGLAAYSAKMTINSAGGAGRTHSWLALVI